MTDPTIKCLVIDDEQLGRDLIANHLKQLPQFEIVAMCSSAIEAAEHINKQHIDLLFLDIEMPVLKGTDFYQNLKHKPRVIFTTAYRNYAIEGFELEAVDYLLKPITFPRFFKAIERFLAQHNYKQPQASKSKGYFFVRNNRKEVKVYFKDILYLQGLKDYIKIHTSDQTLVVKNTLNTLLKSLPEDFIQIHRSYIVNLTHLSAFTKHDVEIGTTEIPIGKTFLPLVMKKIQ